MSRRRLPVVWLFADPRLGDVAGALKRLPRDAAIVVEARDWSADLARIARARGLIVLRPGRRGLLEGAGLRIGRAHNARELVAARRAGACAVFLSPVFSTRSHPGARVLGALKFGLLAHRAGLPVLALGGMNARRGRRLRALGAVGWGAIAAWA